MGLLPGDTLDDQSPSEGPGFLERWIATYIAELLDQEARGPEQQRNAARGELATVIPALWEQQLARDALAVRRSVDYWERRVDEADEPTTSFLRELMANPEGAGKASTGREAFAIRWLAKAEDILTRYLFAVRAAREGSKKGAAGRERDVVLTFGRRDEEIGELAKAAAALAPDLGPLKTTDVSAIERIASSTIWRALQARFVIASTLARDEAPGENDQSGRGTSGVSRGKPASKVRRSRKPGHTRTHKH